MQDGLWKPYEYRIENDVFNIPVYEQYMFGVGGCNFRDVYVGFP
jgi:hypothetical protein